MKITSLLVTIAFTLFTSIAFSCNTPTEVDGNTFGTEKKTLEAEKTYYFSSPIAKMNKGTIRFIDYNQTLKTFEKNYSASLNKAVQVYDMDIKVSEGIFLFSAHTSHGNCGIVLVQVDDQLFESSRTTTGSSTVTSCTGCQSTDPSSTHHCEATGNSSGGVYCSDCPKDKRDCIKTSTITIKSILSDNSRVLAN